MAASGKAAFPAIGPAAWQATRRPVYDGGGAGGAGFQRILDQLSTTPVGAWSLARRRTAPYEGPLVRLRRGSDNAESDFGADGNGDLETASIGVWLGAATGFTVRAYDQSGGGNDLVQATPSSQLQYSASAVGARPGGGGATGRYLQISGAAAIDNLPPDGMCIHAVARAGATVSNFQRARKNWAGNGWRLIGLFSVTDAAGTARTSTGPTSTLGNTDYVDTVNYDGTYGPNAVTWRRNGGVQPIIGPSGGTGFVDDSSQALWAFYTDNQTTQQGAELVLFATVLSAADLQMLNDDATNYYGA